VTVTVVTDGSGHAFGVRLARYSLIMKRDLPAGVLGSAGGYSIAISAPSPRC